jgi:hypothetical protein
MAKLYEKLASLVAARLNCIESGNVEWRDKHEDAIDQLVKNRLPSGSGFDNGTTIDLDASNGEKLVFVTSFHHMNDGGMYDGWTEHTVTAVPSFCGGFTLKISGRNRNDIKDYIGETFHHDLSAAVELND